MALTAKKVFSSHIEEVAYDDAKGRLSVTYKNGNVSHHDGVPPGIAHQVMNAPSIGTALHAHIRGKFNHAYGSK